MAPQYPFEHYKGSPGGTDAAGDKAGNQQAVYNSLRQNVSSQSDAAAGHTSGTLPPNVKQAGKPAEADAGHLGSATVLVKGALKHFSHAITTYNGHVDDLNEEYAAAKKNDFGAIGMCTKDGNEDPTKAAIASARSGVMQRLEKKRQGFEDTLDKAANWSSGMLKKGPTDENILRLYVNGDITGQDATGALGVSISVLNNIRMAVASFKGAVGYKDSIPALLRYLRRVNPTEVTPQMKADVMKIMRKSVMKNVRLGLPWKQRVAAYKSGRPAALRRVALIDSNKPGSLFGKLAKPGSKLAKFGSVAGKALAPLGAVAGVYGVWDTWRNRDNLGAVDEVNGYVGGGATAIAGGLGTAALIMGTAFPPAGVVIGAVAGAVALGSLAVTYRHEIWNGTKAAVGWVGDRAEDTWNGMKNGAEWVGDKSVEFAQDVGETATNVAENVGETATEAWEGAKDIAGDVADTAGDIADDVGDTVSDAADTLGDAVDSITPW